MEQSPTPFIKHINGKWRIMDKTGNKILKAGNDPTAAAADGGGHLTLAEALSQFHAIMRNRM